ncbi:MAG: DUF2815 family protein [Gammaproteobacteria bacterium]|nr:DUF2815 family protein [Gammaproteobacteria bacterium]
MITTNVRFSYLNAFEPKENPSGKLKYSVSILIPKSDEAGIKAIHAAINHAVQKGIDDNKFTKAQVPGLRLPLRDGDEEHEAGNRGPEYQGHFFMNASSDSKPGVVKAQKDSAPVPIFDPDEFFSGCYGRADVNFFPYNQAGNRGVGVGLNNLMLVKEGERLDGRMKAEDAFADYTDEGVETVAAEESIF